jgi:hypothetical protein
VSSRVLFAAAAGVVLGAVVAVVALAGGDDDPEPATLDSACVRDWNDDPASLTYGRHNFTFHDYESALVTHLNSAAQEVPADDERAMCAVVFPSRVLDQEPFAAGQVLRSGVWLPISDLRGVDLTRVAELQVLAADSPNAALDVQGRLGELEGG